MDYMVKEENGTYRIRWTDVFTGDDLNGLRLVERLRRIELSESGEEFEPRLMLSFQTERYDDDYLYLNVHDVYPVILHFVYEHKPGVYTAEWYHVMKRDEQLLTFNKMITLYAANERDTFHESVLWG